MDDLERLLAERACERLVHDFARHADTGNHQALADLFAEDCVLARPLQPDAPYHGRDRVQAIFRDRPPVLVRHLVMNVIVDVISETKARGSNYLVMMSNHDDPHNLPQPSGGIYVGGFEDTYVKTADGWRFQSRHGNVALFTGNPPPKIPVPPAAQRGAPE